MIILKELKNFSDGTSSEIDIKDYILEHPEDIEKMSPNCGERLLLLVQHL